MSDMGLVVVGAAGRMGQTLIRMIHETPGARLAGAIERTGSPQLGKDAGEWPAPALGVAITDDPLPVFAKADGVLDFTVPAATVEFAGYAAQARIVHVIGTTGCTPEDDAKIAAAARHATIVKSGNMSLGVNLLAVLVKQAARRSGRISTSRCSKCIIATRSMRRRARRCCSARLLPGRDIALAENSVRVRDGVTGPRQPGSIGFATLRGGSVIGEHSVIFAGGGERIVLSHHAEDRACSRAARSRQRFGRGPRSPASIPCATCSACRAERACLYSALKHRPKSALTHDVRPPT
jgi:4-hydroxy-tetrahydrodipicolinate reductase